MGPIRSPGSMMSTVPAISSATQTGPRPGVTATAPGESKPGRDSSTSRPSGESRNSRPRSASTTHGDSGPGVATSSANLAPSAPPIT